MAAKVSTSTNQQSQMAQAVQQVYSLFGGDDPQDKWSLALPKVRVPGAKGTDIDWRVVTRALIGQSQNPGG